ncbi:MAG: dihydrodipicolinate synthase family protein [Acidipropionibacterium sp.]|nr:dihydrodipicolinate synthase family protein [Acidipropionibacterium sp.]
MMTENKPWLGVNVATTLPLNEDFSVDYDGYAEHVSYLASKGATGIIPSGSLGEYQTLTEEERHRVVETAIQAVPDGTIVIPGCGAYSTLESIRHAEHAAEAGATAIMLLPPNAYAADDDDVVAHFRAVAKVGLPILAYNNPIDTKVDLHPGLLKRLWDEGLIVAVKDFSGNVRRIWQTKELAPGLDVSIGADDVVFELGIDGARGWVAGWTNALPESTIELYTLSTSDDPESWKKARQIYHDLHPVLRWDSNTWFVQAIKLGQEVAGHKGGVCRPPRQPLPPEVRKTVISQVEKVLSLGYR